MPRGKRKNVHYLYHSVRDLGIQSIAMHREADELEAGGDDERAATLRENARELTLEQHVVNQEYLKTLG